MIHCSLFKWNSSVTCLILHACKCPLLYERLFLGNTFSFFWKRNSTSLFLYGIWFYLFWDNYNFYLRQVTWKQYSTHQCYRCLQVSLLLRYHFKFSKPSHHVFYKTTLLSQAHQLLPFCSEHQEVPSSNRPQTSEHTKGNHFHLCLTTALSPPH